MDQPSAFGPSPEQTTRDMVEGAERLDEFIARNRTKIDRLLGALQAAGGALEVAAGGGLVLGGAATSEFGAGIVVAAAGAWLVWNGHDNARTGWNALTTGDPRPTSLNMLIRGFGLSERAADNLELFLGAAGGAVGAKVGRSVLEKAARAELSRRALQAFDRTTALSVRTPAGSIWQVKDIRVRGDVWELFDAERTGYIRTPNARGFDQISPDLSVAVSNKTLDLRAETYLRADRKALYYTLRRYLNKASTQTPIDPLSKRPLPAARRELHVLLRFGDAVPGQALQLAAAEQYARDLGVKLVIDYAF